MQQGGRAHARAAGRAARAPAERPDLAARRVRATRTSTARTKRLSDEEAVAFMGLLAGAGAETTTKLLGNCVVYLARHPDQRQRLWDDPSLMPQAIEEVLRYDAPSQFQGRVAMRDVTVHGVTIPERARVALVTGAACRDEREFARRRALRHRARPRAPALLRLRQPRLRRQVAGAPRSARRARGDPRALPATTRSTSPASQRTYQAHVRGFKVVPIAT